MAKEFKTIFQTAREEGFAEGLALRQKAATEAATEIIRTAIKGFIQKTRLSDAVIADTLEESVELVKTIREAVKLEKKTATPKKTAKPKS